MVNIYCAYCHKFYREFNLKELPKSFICPECDTPQMTQNSLTASFTVGSNRTGHILSSAAKRDGGQR